MFLWCNVRSMFCMMQRGTVSLVVIHFICQLTEEIWGSKSVFVVQSGVCIRGSVYRWLSCAGTFSLQIRILVRTVIRISAKRTLIIVFSLCMSFPVYYRIVSLFIHALWSHCLFSIIALSPLFIQTLWSNFFFLYIIALFPTFMRALWSKCVSALRDDFIEHL